MKRLIFFSLLLTIMAGPVPADQLFPIPDQIGTVSDYADVVEPQANEKIKTMADELRRVTSVNFKALVIRQLPIGIKMETYGEQVYKKWDVGRSDVGLEHGALLVISILDRRVKIIAGSEVNYVISERSRDQTEWDVLAILARGQFSEGVEIGAMEITNKILAGWYASHKPIRFAVGWQAASLLLFTLFFAAVVVTLVVGGDFMMGFSIFIGGLYGFTFMNLVGLLLFAALGFILTYQAKGRKVTVGKAEKNNVSKTAAKAGEEKKA
jgi:uncharacterized membrane protein YgcG